MIYLRILIRLLVFLSKRSVSSFSEQTPPAPKVDEFTDASTNMHKHTNMGAGKRGSE